MPCTIHIELIRCRLNNKLNIHDNSRIDTIKHVLTAKILRDWQTQFGAIEFYKQWLMAMQYAKRIRLIGSKTVTQYNLAQFGCTDEHGISAFFGAQKLLCEPNQFSASEKAIFSKIGVAVVTTPNFSTVRVDDNPICCMTMNTTTRHSPLEIAPYFRAETDIVIYDRFLNRTATDFILAIADDLRPDARIQILTTASQASDANDCKTKLLEMKSTLQVNTFIADNSTCSSVHDRFIFIGKRYSMRFTRGLDVFGTCRGGSYFNNEGSIIMDDVSEEFRVLNLRALNGTSFEVRTGK